MNSENKQLRELVAIGWIMMLMVIVLMFIIDLSKSAIYTDFSKWASDPGYGGLKALIVVLTIYLFMPMLIRTVNARWFRWTVVVLTIFFTLFFIAHQISHMLAGDKPMSIFHVLDFSHHVLGIWTASLAVIWAREGAAVDREANTVEIGEGEVLVK